MKTIGMIGRQLIHTYAYAMHLAKPDLAVARKAKTAPAWQVQLMESAPDMPPLDGATLTHVWGGLEGVPDDLAATCGLTAVASPDEAIERCDLVMVMDEIIESRSALVRKVLEAGKPVFIDKMPSDDMTVTRELLALAREKGVTMAAWSQQGFCPEYDALKELPPGGVAFVSFAMTMDILKKYGIHLVSSVQGCFPGPYREARLLVSDDEQRLLFLESEQGTRIVAGVGMLYPGGMTRVDYRVDGKAVLIETTDRVGAFRRSATDIVGLLDGKPPRFSIEDIAEAGRLVNALIGA